MSDYINNTAGGELSDGAVIGAEQLGDYSSNFVLLAPGDYDFTVVNLETSRHTPTNPDAKVGSCKKLTVTMRVQDPESGSAVDLKHNLFMWNSSSCLGMIAQYQDSIGIHKKGDPLVFDWKQETHIGKTGKLKLNHREYTGRDGQKYMSNNIQKLYPKENVPAQPAASGGWTPGKF